MADYKTMYHVLFAATEDVLALLEKYMASAEDCSPDADTGNTGERAAKMRPPFTNYLQIWSKKVKNSY